MRRFFSAVSRSCARFTEILRSNGIYQMLVAVGALSVIGIGYGAIQYWAESDDRARARQIQAWTYLVAARNALGDAVHDRRENCNVSNWGLKDPITQLVSSDVVLESLNFPNAHLKGIRIPGSQIPKARLFCANLDNSNLSGVNLFGAEIEFANLACVDLSGANLERAKFLNSNLRRSVLTEATLDQADFSRARLKGAVLTGAKMDGTDFSKAEFEATDFRGADLSRTKGITADQLLGNCLEDGSTVLPSAWSEDDRSSFDWSKSACLPLVAWSDMVKDKELCD